MSSPKPASSTGVVILLILVGGAVATGVAAVMAFVGLYQSPIGLDFRTSTGYYVFQNVLVGFFTAVGVLFTRPRNPVVPIVATVAAYVALMVGIRVGLVLHVTLMSHTAVDGLADALLQWRFFEWDLVAPLTAAVLAGLRFAMAQSGSGSGSGSGQFQQQPAPWGGPGGPGQPGGQQFGQQFGQPGGGQQFGQQPGGGQPFPGQPGPGQPPVPGGPFPGQGGAPGQGGNPGAPQGPPPPMGGSHPSQGPPGV